MSSMKSVWPQRRRKWRDRVAGAGLLAGLFVGLVGCGPPTENVVADQNGTSIRASDIGLIMTNDKFTDEQKRDSLKTLGLSDTLIDVIMSLGVGT